MKIAILLATYNGENYLEKQIESILNQNFKDWILYISDDCSQDRTLEILRSFCNEYPQKIKIINYSMHFGNARDNFFFLFQQVDADLYFFSDQDDVWMPEKISFFLEFYNKLSTIEKKKPIIIHSDLYVVDANLNTISKSFFEYQRINPQKNRIECLLVQNIITGCSMLTNKELKKMFSVDCLDIEDREKILMHDWYFALIAAEFGIIKVINESLVKYRQHKSNAVGAKNIRNIIYIIKKIIKNGVIAEDIEKTKQQANVFRKNYINIISSKTNNIIINYLLIKEFSLPQKTLFLIKNGMLKHGIVRIIGQIIFS